MFIHTIHTNTQRKQSHSHPCNGLQGGQPGLSMTPRTRSQNAALQAREVKRAPLTDTSFTTHQHANDHTKHKKFTQSTKQRIEGGQPTLSTLITPRDVHIPFVSECHMREGQLNRIGIPCSCAAAAVQRTLSGPPSTGATITMDGGVACSVQHNLSTSHSSLTSAENRAARTHGPPTPKPSTNHMRLGLRCEERAPNIPRYLHM